jgi:hypothetical protein
MSVIPRPGVTGGSQTLIEDPDGNPIELHEAPKG